MKKAISIALISLLIWQSMFKFGYIIYWKINQQYITENFCVNKDKPKLNCNGKCYLCNKLEKIDENQESKDKGSLPNSVLKLKSIDNFICFQIDFQIPFIKSFTQNNPSEFYINSIQKGILNTPFQPPEFS